MTQHMNILLTGCSTWTFFSQDETQAHLPTWCNIWTFFPQDATHRYLPTWCNMWTFFQQDATQKTSSQMMQHIVWTFYPQHATQRHSSRRMQNNRHSSHRMQQKRTFFPQDTIHTEITNMKTMLLFIISPPLLFLFTPCIVLTILLEKSWKLKELITVKFTVSFWQPFMLH